MPRAINPRADDNLIIFPPAELTLERGEQLLREIDRLSVLFPYRKYMFRGTENIRMAKLKVTEPQDYAIRSGEVSSRRGKFRVVEENR